MPDSLNMASSGKKGKKSKGKTLSLNDFLQETPGATPSIPIRNPSLSWADEVEDTYDGYESRLNSKSTNVVLPTAPKAARGLDDFSDKIPQNPPFNVYLSNLPYDVNEDEIAEFFSDLKIVSMRIPKEESSGESSRLRGFGYVEFEDQDSLKEALSRPACTLKGRRIRIEVATNTDNDRRRGGRGRMEMNRDRSDRPDLPTGDWRGGRKEPDQPPPPERRYNRDNRDGGGFGRDRDNRDGGGFGRDREGGERSGAWRDSTDRPMRDSHRDNEKYREDKPITRDPGPRDRFDNERKNFGPRREDRNGGGFYSRKSENREEEPRTRPKLCLAPRTVVRAEGGEGASNSSIFGNAKPVDTTARERQIEERIAKLNEEKKDDDKKRDEKRRSPERRRYSPKRSPDRRDVSPRGRRASPERKRSPERRRSPDKRRASPERRTSPAGRRGSPDGRKSPDRKRGSPDRNRGPPKKEEKKPAKADVGKEKRGHREFGERDMPKLKTPEPVNIINENKFAYLEDEGDD